MSHPIAHSLQDARSVEAELRRLWREASSEEHPVMRARVMTLLVATEAAHEAEMAEALSTLMARHPARTILLLLAEDAAREFSATASIFCRTGDHPLCMEQIHLHGSTQKLERLLSAVRLLLDPSLPSTLWWVLPADRHPAARAQLARLVDRQVIDSRLACVQSLFEEPTSTSVDDLAWEATRSWREMVAGLFDPPERSPHLHHLMRVSVEHGPCPVEGWLLVGWLAACLNWTLLETEEGWQFEDPTGTRGTIAFAPTEAGDGIAHLRLETAAQRYEVARSEHHATCEFESATAEEHRVVLPLDDGEPLALLSTILDQPLPDPLYRKSRAALQGLWHRPSER